MVAHTHRGGDVADIVAQFLRALFGSSTEGCIEVRLIEDKKGGAVVARRWYSTVDEFVADLGSLKQAAAQFIAAVYFGLLRRRDQSSGKAENTLPGAVVWADLDFKDFAGGATEARARLARFGLTPSIVVASGHGLHVYFLLGDPTSPELLSDLARRLALVIGGDHTHDASRLLRLPGTVNRKQPDEPVDVILERFDPDQRFTMEELEKAIEAIGAPRTQPQFSATNVRIDHLEIGDSASARVQEIIRHDRKVSGLFLGQGKKPTDKRGNPVDCSSSGYDASLLSALITKGVTDPSELATAIAVRPDGGARGKGAAYIERTVRSALDFRKQQEEDSDRIVDFGVDQIRRFKQTPASYEFTIEGHVFRVTTPDLLAHKKFEIAFTDNVGRVPWINPKKWRGFVNGLLARAEVVPMPPDASDDEALRDAILGHVDDLQAGEDLDDIDGGKMVTVMSGAFAGRMAFSQPTILRRLREDFPLVKRGDVCVHLERAGFEAVQLTTGKRRRVWLKPLKESCAGEPEATP